ncbi:MAG: hypothetical protein ACXVGA_04295 [Mycobacteriaceae bacterium]
MAETFAALCTGVFLAIGGAIIVDREVARGMASAGKRIINTILRSHEWVTPDRAICEAQEPPQTCARCGVALGATDVAEGRQIEENGGNA